MRRIVLAVCVCGAVFTWALFSAVPQAFAVSCVGCSLSNSQVIERNPASGSISFRFTNNVAAAENGTLSHNQQCFYVTSSDGGEAPAFHVWSEYAQGGAPTGDGDELGSRRVLYLDIDSPLTPGCTYVIGCRGLWSFGSHDDSLASGDYRVTVKVAEEPEDPGPGNGSGNGAGDGNGDGLGNGTDDGAGGDVGVGVGDTNGNEYDELPSKNLDETPGKMPDKTPDGTKAPLDDFRTDNTDDPQDAMDSLENEEASTLSNTDDVNKQTQPLSSRAFEPRSMRRESQENPTAVSQGRVYKVSGHISGGGGGGQDNPDEEAPTATVLYPNLLLLLAFLAFAIGIVHRQAWFHRQRTAPSSLAGEKDAEGDARAQ